MPKNDDSKDKLDPNYPKENKTVNNNKDYECRGDENMNYWG